eukprot:COSAG02_NODE_44947_length_361_cov_1.183206_1_plen_50_part_10
MPRLLLLSVIPCCALLNAGGTRGFGRSLRRTRMKKTEEREHEICERKPHA